MKKILSVLLMVCILTVSFVNTVMADEAVGWTFKADATEVNIGDTVIVTLSNNDAMTINSGFIMGLTFNDNFELLECDDAEENYTGFDGPTYKKGKNYLPYFDLSNTILDEADGVVGDTNFLATTGNVEVEAGDITITYVLKATTAGVVAINAINPDSRMQRFDDSINDDVNVPISIKPVTVTVKGAEPPAPTTYTVTYNANGGTTDATPATVEANGAADLTKTASKDGYTFLGWNTDSTATTKLDSYTVTGDVTLYAIYEENPASLLEGIYTRLAKNVTIDYTNKTINLVYDTAQRVFQSSYVAFAPKAADGVTVTYSSKDAFVSDHARLTNYTETASSATNIDLAAEKATSKSAIVGNAIQNAQGTYNFTMHLENVSGEVTEDYQVTVQLTDTSAEVDGLVANSDITATDFKTFRESDEVAINTSTKVITLTTKNMYNYTTIAIDATKIGKNAIATNAARPHRAIELINADDNARYMDFANVELANQYSSAVLVNYVNGETRSYPVRIYGGSDGTSYEEYTLTVVYAPTTNTNDIKIGRIHNIANAKGNSVAEINETGTIQITYDPAKHEIVFSPVYARGYYPTISGDEGKVVTEQQTIAGGLRDVYTITTDNIPAALKYNVRRIRDTRVYDFEFLTK
jgi:uncharacterized repeat protein (TIGR02543 family)